MKFWLDIYGTVLIAVVVLIVLAGIIPNIL